ncbi:hypothetical protein PsorP6_011860 [Peronosclerospora sorghi]|uniref:Uncharacterized protein n=1 Tax=Peronosclerospora sorghi TaxID=230839 RepID=A0ACC0WJ02_9STRA|nr:hypothetical protein PsorP6_011860 [Peronosclerospora sorghi]
MSHGDASCRCAFCGETLSPSRARIPVVFGAPEPVTASRVKPLRWRFLTNKAPCPKLMCKACVLKRQGPSKRERAAAPVTLDTSLYHCHGGGVPPSHETRARRGEPSRRLEHLDARARRRQSMPRLGAAERDKLHDQAWGHRVEATRDHDHVRDDGRRRSSTQPQDSDARWSHHVLHPFANHRVSKEAVERHRASSVFHCTTTRGTPHEPWGDVEKQDDPRLSSTPESFGRSPPSLAVPPQYVDDRASTWKPAPDRTAIHDEAAAVRAPASHDKEHPTHQHESHHERHERRDVLYANMMLRMRHHYDTVQGHGTAKTLPATVPPRRIHVDRIKSVRTRDARTEPERGRAAKATLDLDYLRVYKDAR